LIHFYKSYFRRKVRKVDTKSVIENVWTGRSYTEFQ